MVESLNEELFNKFEAELELEEKQSITQKLGYLKENANFFKSEYKVISFEFINPSLAQR